MGKKVFLVRHGKALKREEWKGEDCKRPLTEKGVKEFEEFASKVKHLFPKKVKIISSPCKRALKTAEILGKVLKKEIEINELLRPDAEPEDYEKVVKSYKGNLILVGHEPDLSLYLNYLTCISPSKLSFKKGGIAGLEKKGDNFKLLFFLPPSIFLP